MATSQRSVKSNTSYRTSGQTTYDKRSVKELDYIQGTAVRKLDVKRAIEEEPRRKVNHTVRKNQEKARHMNLPYLMFLVAAMVASALILVNYITIQSDITNSVKRISKLESEYNTLKAENDELYSSINSSIDLEEIKRIAIGELGMTYAEEGQIVTYTNEGSDYVRQYADIP